MPKKKGDLSEEQLEALLKWLDADREQAGEKYATFHGKVVTLFERKGFFPAQDNADKLFNRIARRLCDPDETRAIRTDDPEKFILGVARTMAWYEKDRNKESSLNEVMEAGAIANLYAVNPAEEYAVTEEERRKEDCLEKGWGELTEDERALLKTYYEFDGQTDHPSHDELAKQRRLSKVGLRSRVMRAKKKLIARVRKCMRDNK